MELTPSSSTIQAIPIEENHQPMIDLRQQSIIAVGPVPECPATEPYYSWLREGVYQRLLEAQRLLPAGLQLRLYEGYRSPQVQAQLFAQELARVNDRNPLLSAEEAWLEATRLVSAPTRPNGDANTPPHSTGAAVDLDIIDGAGQPLDFGMAISDWQQVEPKLCLSETEGLSSRARQNRVLLHGVMTDAGFVDYPAEWWHFCWGDQYWAWRTGQRCAHFGAVTLIE